MLRGPEGSCLSLQCEEGTCLHPAHPPALPAAAAPPRPGSQRGSGEASPEAASRTLLERLGLPAGAIRNVIMHRDIVPRAFACDYTLVADLLARVSDGFREHGCLQNPGGRQVGGLFWRCTPPFIKSCLLPCCPARYAVS